jgi:hypothetical protein
MPSQSYSSEISCPHSAGTTVSISITCPTSCLGRAIVRRLLHGELLGADGLARKRSPTHKASQRILKAQTKIKEYCKTTLYFDFFSVKIEK